MKGTVFLFFYWMHSLKGHGFTTMLVGLKPACIACPSLLCRSVMAFLTIAGSNALNSFKDHLGTCKGKISSYCQLSHREAVLLQSIFGAVTQDELC